MKKIVIVSLFAATLISCNRINQRVAIKHNDEVIEVSNKVIASFDQLIGSLGSYNPDSIDLALTHYNLLVSNSFNDLNKVTSLNDTSLKVETKKMLEVFKSVGENEFKQISDIYHLPDSLYTKTEEKEVNDIATAIDEKIETAELKQQKTQKEFAKKFGFVLMAGKDTIK